MAAVANATYRVQWLDKEGPGAGREVANWLGMVVTADGLSFPLLDAFAQECGLIAAEAWIRSWAAINLADVEAALPNMLYEGRLLSMSEKGMCRSLILNCQACYPAEEDPQMAAAPPTPRTAAPYPPPSEAHKRSASRTARWAEGRRPLQCR